MIFSLQLLTIALAATVAARPGGPGGKPGPNPPSRSTTTIATTTTAAVTTTTKPPQPSSPSSKFFPFWPFRGGPSNNNKKCWSSFKDCRQSSGSGSGTCVSTYAACIGTQANTRMPATSVTSAPGGGPSFIPPLSHTKYHGRVRKCNEAYWACRAQSGSQQSSCISDLSTCLANIGGPATSTGVPPSSTGSAAVSATGSATGTSVAAADPTGQDDDDDDDDDDDSSPSNATS